MFKPIKKPFFLAAPLHEMGEISESATPCATVTVIHSDVSGEKYGAEQNLK